jgi:putative transposase
VFELTEIERILSLRKTKTASLPGGRKDTLMSPKNTVVALARQEISTGPARTMLEEIAREGARRMLQQALEAEVEEYLAGHRSLTDAAGHQLIVRNGRGRERDLVTGIGPLAIRQPRVRDKREEPERFTSKILPPFLRRMPSIDALIPTLYLKGVATSDFSEALQAILGENAAGLSATNIVRLKEGWKKEFETWSQQDLSQKQYVYWWADGVYFNVRLTEERPCVLILMGSLEDGKKELIAILDGERESKASWQTLLRDLKRRGLRKGPKLATGDGALGFWAALEEEYSGVRAQRCWVHKTANLLDKLPKRVQPDAKKLIHEMYMAATREHAMEAYNEFIAQYKAKYPKVVECLTKDKDVLFTFYDFPAEHWMHLRTSNPIESTFATVRHRTRQTKGCGSRLATLSMVFKLAREAEQRWRRLNGHALLAEVIKGVKFVDGIKQRQSAA